MMGQSEDINDQVLAHALKRRMMRDLEERGMGGATQITNNNIGSGGGGGGGGGGMMGGGEMPEDPRDMQYFVDIVRENLEPGDEYDTADGKRKATRNGWRKQVHRFVVPKKKRMGPDLAE